MDNSIKPNLLIIGAMKASTTLLYEMLPRHPAVWFPSEKEPHYFTRPDYGTPSAYEEYLSLFTRHPSGKSLIGEASTGYTKVPYLGPTPQRIRATLGTPKLIYIIRDPVQRTISNFKHSFARGWYPRDYPISRALIEDPIIVGASLYEHQIHEYEAEFGNGSVHVVIAEELHQRPLRVIREIESFLGIAPFDGWEKPVNTVNSAQHVQDAATLDRLVGQHANLRKLSRHAPNWLKSAARRVARIAIKVPQATPVTPNDERLIFNLVADDLIRLRARLGNKLDCWPSARMLSPAARSGSNAV